jgi:predicted ATPase
MKLHRLSITNFRVLQHLLLDDLGDAVVLAGPNGCGKSCVLDALRLLKSAYGSYQQDEWQTWFGEFQLNINIDTPAAEYLPLFKSKTNDLKVSATFSLSGDEIAFLRSDGERLLKDRLWRERTTRSGPGGRQVSARALAANQRSVRAQVESAAETEAEQLMASLDQTRLEADLLITPAGEAFLQPNMALELVFSNYLPQQLGVIDYHGAHRNYSREKLANVSLTIESSEQRLKQHALYNYANKYTNIKTELASAYVRHLLSRQADPLLRLDDSLTETLKELFVTFFPGKEFLGPQPTSDGRLLFPVRLAIGGEHDIDELSSGEKEIVYGYLRLHNAAPRNSIIMIDEPELHLNPRLVSGLASFYYRRLGKALGNQIWLVTHSDTLIREAVQEAAFSVFHIHATPSQSGSQGTRVAVKAELERVVIDLVGDLAAYRPGAKIVVFESTEGNGFDATMTLDLFPELDRKINVISAGSKSRVHALYDLLDKAREDGHLPATFFAVTDADDEIGVMQSSPRRLQWDSYHIENYLLQPRYIWLALQSIGIVTGVGESESSVEAALAQSAKSTVASLLQHRLRIHANRQLVGAIDLSCDPRRDDASVAISEAIIRSQTRMNERANVELSPASLQALEQDLRRKYEDSITDGTWVEELRGRDVLRRFVGQHIKSIQYEPFRNLILSKMRDEHFQPAGMRSLVSAILSF